MVSVSKDLLRVKYPALNILIAVIYCGRQLARRFGWAAPASHKKEGPTPHPGLFKYSLQSDGRPDECFGVQVGCEI